MKKQVMGLAAAAMLLGSSASQAAFSCDDPLKSSFGQSFCVNVFDSLAEGDYKVSFQYQAEKSSGLLDRTLDFGFLFGGQDSYPVVKTLSDSTATAGWNTYSFIAKAGGDSFLAFSLLGFYPQRFSLALQNIQVTPVPEPASFAMLLAGLGAIVFVSRRRRPS